jgi:hypothetical protein
MSARGVHRCLRWGPREEEFIVSLECIAVNVLQLRIIRTPHQVVDGAHSDPPVSTAAADHGHSVCALPAITFADADVAAFDMNLFVSGRGGHNNCDDSIIGSSSNTEATLRGIVGLVNGYLLSVTVNITSALLQLGPLCDAELGVYSVVCEGLTVGSRSNSQMILQLCEMDGIRVEAAISVMHRFYGEISCSQIGVGKGLNEQVGFISIFADDDRFGGRCTVLVSTNIQQYVFALPPTNLFVSCDSDKSVALAMVPLVCEYSLGQITACAWIRISPEVSGADVAMQEISIRRRALLSSCGTLSDDDSCLCLCRGDGCECRCVGIFMGSVTGSLAYACVSENDVGGVSFSLVRVCMFESAVVGVLLANLRPLDTFTDALESCFAEGLTDAQQSAKYNMRDWAYTHVCIMLGEVSEREMATVLAFESWQIPPLAHTIAGIGVRCAHDTIISDNFLSSLLNLNTNMKYETACGVSVIGYSCSAGMFLAWTPTDTISGQHPNPGLVIGLPVDNLTSSWATLSILTEPQICFNDPHREFNNIACARLCCVAGERVHVLPDERRTLVALAHTCRLVVISYPGEYLTVSLPLQYVTSDTDDIDCEAAALAIVIMFRSNSRRQFHSEDTDDGGRHVDSCTILKKRRTASRLHDDSWQVPTTLTKSTAPLSAVQLQTIKQLSERITDTHQDIARGTEALNGVNTEVLRAASLLACFKDFISSDPHSVGTRRAIKDRSSNGSGVVEFWRQYVHVDTTLRREEIPVCLAEKHGRVFLDVSVLLSDIRALRILHQSAMSVSVGRMCACDQTESCETVETTVTTLHFTPCTPSHSHKYVAKFSLLISIELLAFLSVNMNVIIAPGGSHIVGSADGSFSNGSVPHHHWCGCLPFYQRVVSIEETAEMLNCFDQHSATSESPASMFAITISAPVTVKRQRQRQRQPADLTTDADVVSSDGQLIQTVGEMLTKMLKISQTLTQRAQLPPSLRPIFLRVDPGDTEEIHSHQLLRTHTDTNTGRVKKLMTKFNVQTDRSSCNRGVADENNLSGPDGDVITREMFYWQVTCEGASMCAAMHATSRLLLLSASPGVDTGVETNGHPTTRTNPGREFLVGEDIYGYHYRDQYALSFDVREVFFI